VVGRGFGLGVGRGFGLGVGRGFGLGVGRGFGLGLGRPLGVRPLLLVIEDFHSHAGLKGKRFLRICNVPTFRVAGAS